MKFILFLFDEVSGVKLNGLLLALLLRKCRDVGYVFPSPTNSIFTLLSLHLLINSTIPLYSLIVKKDKLIQSISEIKEEWKRVEWSSAGSQPTNQLNATHSFMNGVKLRLQSTIPLIPFRKPKTN